MKTGKVRIGNKEYVTCFSVRVMLNLREKYGDIEKGLQGVAGVQNIEDAFWIVYELMKAGAQYAKLEGIENPPLPEYDTCLDLVGVDDLPEITNSIVDTVKNGSKTVIKTEPSEETKKNSKNAKTTQEQ